MKARRVFLSVRHGVFLEWHGLAADYVIHTIKLAIISKSTLSETETFLSDHSIMIVKNYRCRLITNLV